MPSFLVHYLINKTGKGVMFACGREYNPGNNQRCTPKSRYVECKACQRTRVYKRNRIEVAMP